jgi:hypothetical protein
LNVAGSAPEKLRNSGHGGVGFVMPTTPLEFYGDPLRERILDRGPAAWSCRRILNRAMQRFN